MVTQEFEALGHACARARGYPDIPFVILPHPFETLPPEVARNLAEEKLQEIGTQLITPVEPLTAPRA